MDVGVIGLGAMGGTMAEALVAAGHRVLVYDVSAPAVERATTAGAQAAASVREVAATVPVILLSLPKPEHVETVVSGPDGILTAATTGLVVVDTSTVDPETTRRLAARASAIGVGYLDAPVLGRPDICGSWTFPVGGDPEVLDRARPCLDVLGQAIIHVGPHGSGNAIKLLNNLMFGAINAITAEVMSACAVVGVSPRTFYETVASSGAATVSPLFRQLGQKIIDEDYAPVFTVDLLHKDVALGLAMLEKQHTALIVGSAVQTLIGLARAAGHGMEDSSSLVKVYESLLGSRGTEDPPSS